MMRNLYLVPVLSAGFAAIATFASAATGSAPEVPRERAAGIRFAQAAEVEVYFDGNGNRVIVDAYTGEVIAVERPRRALNRQQERRMRRMRELDRQERYYLDDPEDMAALRRRKAQDGYGYDYNEGPVDSYDPGIREYDPYESRDFGVNEFPEAPPADVVGRPRRQALPEAVERRPLDEQEVTSVEPGDQTGTVGIDRAPLVTDGQPVVTEPPVTFTAREDVAAVQVLMDRAGASPGVIDGKFGSNVDKALAAYREITGTNLKSTDAAGIKEALAASGGDPFKSYTITAADAAGPFVASIPADYGQKAKLERLGYTSVTEALAERFHMDEAYLKALNPQADFSKPGTIIRVANIGTPVASKVARIVANKGKKQLFAFDAAGKLVAAYPTTIGSSDTPSPTGTHTVSRVAFNPDYTYNPNLNFKQGDNDKVLTLPPGPNGPVGSIWIALDKPTYGIHGTPDPSKIGKTESHGCVRLTNWDAEELAKLVSPGVIVQFID